MTPAQAKIKRWREDPLFFATDELKMDPDPWQVELFRVFADPTKRRIAMQACKGVGKTAGLAVCILNFMSCYANRGEHPKGAATSISEQNIDDNLWPEISKWQNRSEFLKRAFTWTKTRFFATENPETWFFSKRTWPKTGDRTQQANTLAGLHAKYLLYVIDESGGVPDAVMAAAEGGLTGSEADAHQKILQSGNPTHLSGPLYRAATTERRMWHLIIITGDPDDPQRSRRQSIEWAREQIEKYGKDNPWVVVNVFGRFPQASLNTLLGPDEVNDAMRRQAKYDDYAFAQKRIGVDVARFGDDRTVLFPRQGLMAFRPVELRGMRTTDIAARVMNAKVKWGSELELIDDTGHWGHGVIDNLIAAGMTPLGIQFHAPALDARYKNRRAEMWLTMAEWVKRGGCIPNIPDLVGELTVPTYTFVNGKFQLEEKDQIKERLGRSPDLADGLALTFAIPDLPALEVMKGRAGFTDSGKVKSDWDPYRNPT